MSESYTIFSNNADIKYPLSDFHKEDIPNNILTGLSLSLPPGIEPVLTGLRTVSQMAFVSIEDKLTGNSIASALIDSPVPGRIYPLDTEDGISGWVMFGPGVLEVAYYSGVTSIDLDPEVITEIPASTDIRIGINGEDAVSVDKVLQLLSDNNDITVSIEDGVIYFDRNDEELTESTIQGYTATGAIAGEEDTRIYTIGGVRPDGNGNIDIDVPDCIERCVDVNNLDIDRGDNGAGEGTTLPLDIFFPKEYSSGDPCDPGGEVPEQPPEEEQCHSITKTTITNEDGDDVGTLYSPDGGS